MATALAMPAAAWLLLERPATMKPMERKSTAPRKERAKRKPPAAVDVGPEHAHPHGEHYRHLSHGQTMKASISAIMKRPVAEGGSAGA